MTVYLLDANVIIALTVDEHVLHDRAGRWFETVSRVALCPVSEGALVRYLVRTGVSASSSRTMIAALHDDARFEFWPDDLSYGEVDLRHVIGHRQVTDTYLASLAAHHGGLLATFDRGLAQTLSTQTFLIPD